MKYLLLVFCLLFTAQVFGQRKKKRRVKPKTFLHFQGGYMFDNSLNFPYRGFNIVNLGWSKLKDKTQRSIELELIGYNVKKAILLIDDFNNLPPIDTRGFTGKRRSVELIYNHSFGLGEEITDGFFLGPSGSLIFNSLTTAPLGSSVFPTREICLCIGVGMNAGYNWSINKKNMLRFSTRISFVDLGWERTRVSNPSFQTVRRQRINSFKTDFLRNQFQVMVGLNFKI